MEEKQSLIPEEQWSIEKNKKINRLTLVGPVWHKLSGSSPRKVQMGKFECECGTEKIIKLDSVKYGHTQSCGCLQRKAAISFNSQKRKGTFAKDGLKTCANENCRCNGVPQPVESFSRNKHSQDGFYHNCKQCVKNSQYERLYKQTLTEYEEQIARQNNVCDFCGLPFDRTTRRLMDVQDHNHTTGHNRGVVHSVCNFMIENFESFPEMFRSSDFKMANDYFKKWEQAAQTLNLASCLENVV